MKAQSPGAADTAERPTRSWRDALGPGLITGASDDDPSGIATYAQAGARFGFQLSWTLLVTYPLMVAVQAISARIGRTTGRGIAGNLRRHYPPWILQATAALLCLANTINIGADLGAMAAAMQLLTHALPAWVWVVAFGVASTLAQILVQYRRYVSVLKWLSVSLLAYFAVLFTVHVPWGDVLRGLLLPRWSMNAAFWQMVVAILGTTISPYLLFWQASQEAEDVREVSKRQPLRNAPRQAAGALARIRIDTLIGMGYSNLVALAILVTTAATLRKSGVHEITTAAQAAQALRPVAGEFASAVFALGIIGTGLLAVPVLAGSAAYGLGEAFRWPVGLARKALQAKAFYGTIAAMTLVGAIANAGSLNPIKALVWSAVVNGLVAVPVMALVMVMACDRRIMGTFTVSRRLKIVGWMATAVMALAALGMAASVLLGGD
jgi:NRAMP (natural resistance-associated macrophage protein)-like metal ion transporter